MGSRRTLASLVALASLGLSVPALATAAAAEEAPDTTPPTVSLDPYARLRVGSQVQTYYEGGSLAVWNAGFYLSWQADDTSGICEQTLARQSYEHLGENPDDPIFPGGVTGYTTLDPAARTADVGTDSFNHGRVAERFYVRVTDCAGNTTLSNVADLEFGTREDDAASIQYQRKWRIRHLDDYSGGTVHRSRSRGSSLTATFQGVGPIALVMSTGPDNGKADVYVDGILQTTVDTYAAEDRNRVVVWEGEYVAGTHTLRVVNRATRGRPHIDFDTLVICEAGRCIPD